MVVASVRVSVFQEHCQLPSLEKLFCPFYFWVSKGPLVYEMLKMVAEYCKFFYMAIFFLIDSPIIIPKYFLIVPIRTFPSPIIYKSKSCKKFPHTETISRSMRECPHTLLAATPACLFTLYSGVSVCMK